MSVPEQRKDLIDIFIERNSKINLSAIREPQDIYEKHIKDSLKIQDIFPLHDFAGASACDLGTGGGFPLLPLSILYPEIQWTGIDARRKKIDAIKDMTIQLGLQNCKTIHIRAEQHKKKYDIVTARAVTYADKLLPRVDHLLKKGGICILYKLYTPEEDKIIHKFGWEIIKNEPYTIHSNDEVQRKMYVLKKPK